MRCAVSAWLEPLEAENEPELDMGHLVVGDETAYLEAPFAGSLPAPG